jgi:hypothetical protein
VQREPAKAEPGSDASSFTRGQRLKALLIGWAGSFTISLIGWTVRWKSEGDEHLEEIYRADTARSSRSGMADLGDLLFRNRGIVVLTSMNLDGEAIAQCIKRFGYGWRGSSSRGRCARWRNWLATSAGAGMRDLRCWTSRTLCRKQGPVLQPSRQALQFSASTFR